MHDAFISYRRAPSYPTAQLIQTTLRAVHHIDAYLDVTRADSARVQFPDRLLSAIAESKVFVCLLAPETLESSWVLKEIRFAHALGKPCLPVFQEQWTAYSGGDPSVNYLLSFDAVHVMEKRGLYVEEAIRQMAGIIAATPDQPLPDEAARERARLFSEVRQPSAPAPQRGGWQRSGYRNPHRCPPGAAGRFVPRQSELRARGGARRQLSVQRGRQVRRAVCRCGSCCVSDL
jgi:hypothetical protein